MATATADGTAVVCETIEVTQDEADRRMRGEGWDPLAVRNKDPNFHYRWLNKNKLNLARKVDYLGYEIVSGGKETSVLNESTRVKKATDTTGAIEQGDLVLARIPKDLHKRYRDANNDLIKRRTQAVRAQVTRDIDTAGGKRGLAYEENADNPAMRST